MILQFQIDIMGTPKGTIWDVDKDRAQGIPINTKLIQEWVGEGILREIRDPHWTTQQMKDFIIYMRHHPIASNNTDELNRWADEWFARWARKDFVAWGGKDE